LEEDAGREGLPVDEGLQERSRVTFGKPCVDGQVPGWGEFGKFPCPDLNSFTPPVWWGAEGREGACIEVEQRGDGAQLPVHVGDACWDVGRWRWDTG